MSQGLWAIGCIFKFTTTAAPAVYQTFPEVIDISWNRGSREKIDLTNHDSTPPFEEFVMGIATGAQLDITFNCIPANTVQEDLEDEWLSDTPINFRIIYNDAAETTYSFSGYVSAYNTNHNTRDAHRGSATISCTGAWSRSTGGS